VRHPRHLAIARFLLALYAASGLASTEALEAGVAPAPVSYSSFVCWDYAHLPQLRAWKESERLIGMTLAEGYPGLQSLAHEENGSPAQLKDFLRKLLDAPGRIDLVYLAAHQSRGGRWYFPDGSVTDWATLAEGLPPVRNPQRIVLLDCCFAQAASQWPEWPQKIAPACVFASTADQLTPDLFVFWRRPVDWAAQFPGATQWLRQHHVTDSDERISFLGLVWLEAWTKQPSPPRTMADWRNFAQAMTQIAQHASTQIHDKYVSSISASFSP
jgi:hypothetical protein